MKRPNLILLTMITAAAIIISCSDEEDPTIIEGQDSIVIQRDTVFIETDSLTEVTLAELGYSELSMNNAILKSYAYLFGNGGWYNGASNWFWGSVLGGDANKGSNDGDQSQVNEIMRYTPLANNASITSKWNSMYEAIDLANQALVIADSIKDDEEVDQDNLAIMIAEAKFLRAHYYFDLTKNFKNVPYRDETWNGTDPIPNDEAVWVEIESDFSDAFTTLPTTRENVGRANKWAAAAYLGKIYLFQGKFVDAKTMFDQVISSGVTSSGESYALLDDYGKNFRAQYDNNSESVFSSQAVANSGNSLFANPEFILNFPHGSNGSDRPGGCCGFFQPSLSLANSFRTDDSGLPLLDGSFNDSENELDTDLGLLSSNSFTPDDGNLDPRIDHSIGRRGIPYLDWGEHPGADWIRDQAYGGPYSPKKFVYTSDLTESDNTSWTPGYTAINYDIIRYADVLLMAAEAEIEAGNLNTARDYINQVRTRASNSIIMNGDSPAANYVISNYSSFADAAEARNAVRFERKLELSGEGHRFFDLVRWGIANDELDDYISYESSYLPTLLPAATFDEGDDEYLPIPQSVIDEWGDDVITQN